ncbi:chemotaxis protein CheW [Croceicoccus sp. YJ47]|uniref:chemotaxis protein CheW n=1 Tax=Croceicoccus sp. YJ47 TaxID=2798724 RepID=UPI001924BDD0|nr:chemotaxis protein CheW [Croceicoccus sp. YJ47]QQN74322.1 chemotaxis protein CheW [Croceicoccus sp. YJ47]
MTAAAETQVVTFGLGDEIFAVSVGMVREILDYAPVFRVPQGPEWLLGLTEVRGTGIPTVDLRTRMGLPAQDPTLATRILIVDLALADRAVTMGLVVDRVLAVRALASEQIEPAPDIGMRWRSDYIQGVVRLDEGFVILMDLAAVFSNADTAMLPGLQMA